MQRAFFASILGIAALLIVSCGHTPQAALPLTGGVAPAGYVVAGADARPRPTFSFQEMIALGLARYVCEPHRGKGCQAIVITPLGMQLTRRDVPTPPPHPHTIPPSQPPCANRTCPTPLPTLPPFPGGGTGSSSESGFGLGPPDYHSAYRFPVHGGQDQTVAVIEVSHDPYLEHDLDIYREQYGLPVCTFQGGCLRQVDGSGGKNFPPDVQDYAEESLDVDMVSAICQDCNILVVETNVPNLTSNAVVTGPWITALIDATNTAVNLGANAVSLSLAAYSGAFTQTQFTTDEALFSHPGVVITASSGDSGFNGEVPQQDFFGNAVPAGFSNVVGVGATSLTENLNLYAPRGWKESAWIASGSGCGLDPSPSFQLPLVLLEQPNGYIDCRYTPDIAFNGDATTGYGPLVYSTVPSWLSCPACSMWQEMGGTSASSPAIAAAYMLASTHGVPEPSLATLYAHYQNFPGVTFDITTGTNNLGGYGCLPSVLCNTATGFDGPTGVGTPNGIGLFLP